LIKESEVSSFASVGARGFLAMLDLERLVDRSHDFDRLILSRESNSWSPLDRRYLDFEASFDLKERPLIDEGAFACLAAPIVANRLRDPKDRVRFINKIAWIRFSNLLYGEQGALNLSASLCAMLRDQGAQEFAANQTREEARHVTAFARYIKVRWGRPAPIIPALKDFLFEIINSDDVSKKIIGMQVMVEGLAMGSLGGLYRTLLDPLGKRLVQLVMTDEATHHRFGKLWAEQTMPNLVASERRSLEEWTSHCLRDFIVKMNPPFELYVLSRDFGIDPLLAAQEIEEVSRSKLVDTALGTREIFGVLTRSLLAFGLLNDASYSAYQKFVEAGDSADLEAGYEEAIREGLAFLRGVSGEST
jgi:hypothetical protein